MITIVMVGSKESKQRYCAYAWPAQLLVVTWSYRCTDLSSQFSQQGSKSSSDEDADADADDDADYEAEQTIAKRKRHSGSKRKSRLS